MSIGMLWFDNDPKASQVEKVRRAAAYYREKYGKEPNMCFVRSLEGTANQTVDGITVKPSKQILPNHLWLGVETEA
jgi:hypothetical protein